MDVRTASATATPQRPGTEGLVESADRQAADVIGNLTSKGGDQ